MALNFVDDGKSHRLGIGLSALMLASIGAAIIVGTPAVWGSIACFGLATIIFSLKDGIAALGSIFAYSAMEGMFKYATNFSPLVYAIKPALVFCVAISALIHCGKTSPFRTPPLCGIVVCVAFWGALMALVNPYSAGVLQGLTTLLLWYVLPSLLYFAAFNSFHTFKDLERFIIAMTLICTVVSAFAVVQFNRGREWTEARVPGYTNLATYHWTGYDREGDEIMTYRPASTASLGGGGAAWAHLGLITSVGLLLRPRLPVGSRIVFSVCVALNTAGITVSGVRLFAVATSIEIVVLIVFLAISRRIAIHNVAVVAGGLVFVVAGFVAMEALSGGIFASRYFDTLANPVGRYNSERSVNMLNLPAFLLQYPFGIGFQRGLGGKGGEVSDRKFALVSRETQFNAAGADMGVVGVILTALILFGGIVIGWKVLQRLQLPRLVTLCAVLLALMVGFGICAFGGPVLLGNEQFWLTAAMLFALPHVQSREKSRIERLVSQTQFAA